MQSCLEEQHPYHLDEQQPYHLEEQQKYSEPQHEFRVMHNNLQEVSVR
jgi:hypothetical protein